MTLRQWIVNCRDPHYHRFVNEAAERIASSYRRFAEQEAHGRSKLYEELAQGDVRVDLLSLASQPPSEATLVIFHTAVLAYIQSANERNELANTIAGLKGTWISNEAPAFRPCVDERPMQLCPVGLFLLVKNNKAIACTDPHGKSIRWLTAVS